MTAFNVVAEMELAMKEPNGNDWPTRLRLPLFTVDAPSASEAKRQVVEVLCMGRLIKGPIHVTMCTDGDDADTFPVTILPVGHEIPAGTQMVHWLIQDDRAIPIP